MFGSIFFVLFLLILAANNQDQYTESEKEFALRVCKFSEICEKVGNKWDLTREEIEHSFKLMNDTLRGASFGYLGMYNAYDYFSQKYIQPSIVKDLPVLTEILLIPNVFSIDTHYYSRFNLSSVQDFYIQQFLAHSLVYLHMKSVRSILSKQLRKRQEFGTKRFVELLLTLFHYRYHSGNDIEIYSQNFECLFTHLFVYFIGHTYLSLAFNFITQEYSANQPKSEGIITKFNFYEDSLRQNVSPLLPSSLLDVWNLLNKILLKY